MNGLEEIVAAVSPPGRRPAPRLHVHYFNSLKRAKTETDPAMDLSFAEALALLERRPYTPERRTWLQQVEKCKQWVLGPTGIFAAKSATAGSIFA